MKLVRIAGIALLVLVVGAVAGVGRPDAAQGVGVAEANGGVTVNGMGVIRTTPDIAELGLGVVTRGATAQATLAANGPAVRKLVAALRAAGIAPADLQTQQAALEPRSDENGERILGYIATTIVSAKIRALAKVPAIVDAAVAAGANTVYGPALSRSDADALYANALEAAMADARVKAKLLADAGNLTLGAPTAVVESGFSPVDAKAAEGRLSAADAPAIEPGSQDVVAAVTVTYAIQ
jgi:uncharacterized protein YggE